MYFRSLTTTVVSTAPHAWMCGLIRGVAVVAAVALSAAPARAVTVLRDAVTGGKVVAPSGPSDQVAVPYAFPMGKYAVTNGQHAAFLDAVVLTETYGDSDAKSDTDAGEADRRDAVDRELVDMSSPFRSSGIRAAAAKQAGLADVSAFTPSTSAYSTFERWGVEETRLDAPDVSARRSTTTPALVSAGH